MEHMHSIRELVERRLARRIVADPGEVAFTCTNCEDTGWERYEDEQRRLWARRCECKVSAPIPMQNCPDAFRAIRIDDLQKTPQNADAIEHVRQWVSRGNDLFLHGRPGRGKTMLACAAVNEMHKPAQFELVDTLLGEIVRADEDGEHRSVLVNIPVLVLDDVGVADTDWARRFLTTIYSERLARSKRTIFTSNKTIKELVGAWQDERLASRIVGAADIVVLEGPDFRRKRC